MLLDCLAYAALGWLTGTLLAKLLVIPMLEWHYGSCDEE